MKNINKLLGKAQRLPPSIRVDYDMSKLSTKELKELISETITEERFKEILEPVRIERG